MLQAYKSFQKDFPKKSLYLKYFFAAFFIILYFKKTFKNLYEKKS